MSKKTTTLFWLCLLCLFPLLSKAQTLSHFDYWIDDNIGDMQTKSLSGSSAEIVEELDLSALPTGVHKVHFRVVQSDGYCSAVSSLHFFKGVMGSDGTLEYWFDDMFENRISTSFDGGNGEMQELTLDLRNSNTFPTGFHKLNLRVIMNGKASSVYTSHVLKLMAGTPSKLEYWIDGNIGASKTIEGQLSADGSVYVYTDDLDLTDVSPGYHRLSCRGVSSSRQTVTPVVSTTVIVKSRYNVEDPEKLAVTDQVYWFDNEEPEYKAIAYPKNIINQQDNFDIRGLSDGQHTLHLRFGNSVGGWSAPVNYTFTKQKEEEPVIKADMSIEEGVATFSFNSISYGFHYNLIRQYPSGTERLVKRLENSQHPETLQIIDMPAPGTYTYFVEGVYTGSDGKTKKVRSNAVSVEVDKAADALKLGNIDGVITHNGKEILYQFYSDYNVLINGVDANKSGYGYRQLNSSHFQISNVPYGTELTLLVEEKNFSHKSVNIIVNENTCHSTYRFDGTSNGDNEMQPENTAYDLKLVSDVTITPSAWELHLYNPSSKTWKGNLMVIIVNKKHKDVDDIMESGETPSIWETAFIPKNYFETRPYYVTSADQYVTFEGEKQKVISLDIIDMPEEDETSEYYIWVYSKREGSDQIKELLSYTPQPFVLDFNPFDFFETVGKGYMNYMKGYAKVLKLMKKFSAWGDPFKLAWSSVGTSFDNYIKTLEEEEDDKELNADVVDAAIKSTGLLLNCFFSDMNKAVQLYTKKVKGSTIYNIHEKMESFYSVINDNINVKNADDNHKFFELAKLVLKYSKLDEWTNDPVVSVYKTYFEVGEAMASAAERFSNEISSKYVWDRIATGNSIYNIKIRRYSHTGKNIGYFPGHDYYLQKGAKTSHDGMIETMWVELKNPSWGEPKVQIVGSENVELTNEGITIRNLKFAGGTADSQTMAEAWLIIKWKNKRVTRVPLLNEEFVNIENLHSDVSKPLIVTVELQSEANQNVENIPQKLTFVKP